MAFAKEQADIIKKQLLSQVDKLPQENKGEIKSYIESLNEEQLEEFLKQNKIQISKGKEEGEKQPAEMQCIFCEIIKEKISSYKIAENKKSIAILEINPLSKGHVIIIPLKHEPIEKIPKSALALSQKITKKIKKKLKPDDIKIETSNFQGHSIINIIPIYKDIPLKKTQATEKELKTIQSRLETKTRSKRKNKYENKDKKESKPAKPEKNLPKISFRIP